ncbi:MAG: class I SAM-dependent methyltransferase [Ruminococcus sp.]|nr:class I SAM-dependent methyltransferase [Ruminococcus sp.]
MNNLEKSIAASKENFEAAFSEKNFYNKQTNDKSHLEAILDILPIKSDMRILDLGTGSGYLAFALANKYPKATIIGLDIVEKALDQNRHSAKLDGLSNISFFTYNGITFPFENRSFDMVVSRYALHHFPDISKSISEVSRVLTDNGYFFISDPTPNEEDIYGFVDEYMQVKTDGHIRFRSYSEWIAICKKSGFKFTDSFKSIIRFPRKYDKIYATIMNRYPKEIVNGYGIKTTKDEILITEQVNNILFCKGI